MADAEKTIREMVLDLVERLGPHLVADLAQEHCKGVSSTVEPDGSIWIRKPDGGAFWMTGEEMEGFLDWAEANNRT